MQRASLLAALLVLHWPGLTSAAPPADLGDGLAVGTPAEVHLQRAPLESLTPELVARDYPGTTSLLVYRNGLLVHERYFGNGGVNLLNDTRSVSKTLTALAVGSAVGAGILRSPEEPAFELLPDLRMHDQTTRLLEQHVFAALGCTAD